MGSLYAPNPPMRTAKPQSRPTFRPKSRPFFSPRPPAAKQSLIDALQAGKAVTAAIYGSGTLFESLQLVSGHAYEIAAYDADPEFKKKLAGTASARPSEGSASSAPAVDAKPDPSRAKSLLSLANSYRDSGNTDKAREKYQDVISQFPGTPEADTAKDELAKLPQ